MKHLAVRFLCLILVLLLSVPAFAEDPETAARQPLTLPEGAVVELTVEDDPHLGPKDGCYLYESGETKIPYGYEDPSISIRLGHGRVHDTDYVFARIKIAMPTQLRTAMAGKKYPNKQTAVVQKQAERVKAVLAINGDYFNSPYHNWGTVIRQGVKHRMKCDGVRDVLIIDDKGDLHIIEDAKNEDVEAFDGTVVNAFTFGPALVVNGTPKYGVKSNAIGTHISAQRMAIAQVGPLEYMVITSEGPDDPDSKGLTLDQFAELVSTFEDVTNAYNLDGGSSSTIAFRKGKSNWGKYNCPKNQKTRSVGDIIYFADAYMGN